MYCYLQIIIKFFFRSCKEILIIVSDYSFTFCGIFYVYVFVYILYPKIVMYPLFDWIGFVIIAMYAKK